MLNRYVWDLYLRSGGSDVVKFFEEQLTQSYTVKYANFIAGLHKSYCPMRSVGKWLKSDLIDVKKYVDDGIWILGEGEYCIESALTELYETVLLEDNGEDKVAFADFAENIVSISTQLAIELPELFVPYYFQYTFNVLEKIAEEFEIELPEIPVKKAYKNRVFYYGDICAALYDFRMENDLSPYELCAFLYDFAPKYIGGTESYIIQELPEPRSAFFIGAERDDLFLADNEDEIDCWQCNPDTMPGDMVVMYMKSPVSKVDSVWRSVSMGFNDPFFYYYRCTYISKPKRIKPISLQQLKTDPIYRELPIVRKNMQGINGVELMPSVYNRMIEQSGADLPRLKGGDFAGDSGYANEKDVENKLIKPLLKRLGYSEHDYQQQMVIRLGNHNTKLIPDFVIHPKTSFGHQSAYFLIEAKHTITTKKQLEEAKLQARSYAKQFSARYTVVAAQEGVWVMSALDDYSDCILECSWENLGMEDSFYKLFSLLGKWSK